jgi:VanZ family protein
VLGIGSLHHVPQPRTGLPLDKVAHFAMYGILGLLAATGWRRSGRTSLVILPFVLAILVGAADEVHQRSVTGRSSDVWDFAADALGITIAFAFVLRRKHDPGMGTE